MMQIIKHGKDVYFTEDGHNVTEAVREIIKRAKEEVITPDKSKGLDRK